MSFRSSVVCDRCGFTKSYSYVDKTTIKRWLREEGWSVNKEKCTCPKCKKEKKEK